MGAPSQFVDLGGFIEVTPGYRGSRPHIAGSGVTVDRIAVLHTIDAMGAAEIASDLGLSLGQVHAALAFFHLNRELFEEWLNDLERSDEEGADCDHAQRGLHL